MSGLKALDELREWISTLYTPNSAELKTKGESIADRIEAEIDERFMELPVDADGVPIHVGDEMEVFDCPPQDYSRFIVVGYTSELPGGKGKLMVVDDGDCAEWYGCTIHHIKPRTVEDVLREFADRYLDYEGVPSAGRRGVGEALMGEYVYELRELIGGGE